MITILSWGGIGDTLRNIGLIPHRFLFEKFGIRCRVVRFQAQPVVPVEHPDPPPEFFRELIERCPSLAWAGEIDKPKRYGRIVTRCVRNAAKLLNRNTPRYFPFDFQLTEQERKALPRFPTGFVLGIQTHLSGMQTKLWGLSNWQCYLNILLAEEKDISILLIDNAPQVEQLCCNARIQSTHGLHISQSIALVQQLDWLVSIDSWSKYVAASRKIPQLIVIPDQRPDYPELSADYLAQNSFEGIFNQPQNVLIGLSGTLRQPQATLEQMADLSPWDLARKTLAMIRKSEGRALRR